MNERRPVALIVSLLVLQMVWIVQPSTAVASPGLADVAEGDRIATAAQASCAPWSDIVSMAIGVRPGVAIDTGQPLAMTGAIRDLPNVLDLAATRGIAIMEIGETPFAAGQSDQHHRCGMDTDGNAIFVSIATGRFVAVAAQSVPICDGRPVTIWSSGQIIGTNGPDVIGGSFGPDAITALKGNDAVCSFQGDDIVYLGQGQDKGWGGKDQDFVSGDKHDDLMISGDLGTDQCVGGPGRDIIDSSCESIQN